MAQLRTHLGNIGSWLLDFLLPRPPLVRFLEHADSAQFSERARKAAPLAGCASCFDYRDPVVKRLVWEIKFKGNRKLAALAARLLYDELLAELAETHLFAGAGRAILIPVPLAPKRLRERGFNQTERIAEELARLDGNKYVNVVNAVARVKETKSQTQTKSRAEREENMRGAFAVREHAAVFGAHCIVLDDVTTTGSTIAEIKKVLLQAGAAKVTALTLAH